MHISDLQTYCHLFVSCLVGATTKHGAWVWDSTWRKWPSRGQYQFQECCHLHSHNASGLHLSVWLFDSRSDDSEVHVHSLFLCAQHVLVFLCCGMYFDVCAFVCCRRNFVRADSKYRMQSYAHTNPHGDGYVHTPITALHDCN